MENERYSEEEILSDDDALSCDSDDMATNDSFVDACEVQPTKAKVMRTKGVNATHVQTTSEHTSQIKPQRISSVNQSCIKSQIPLNRGVKAQQVNSKEKTISVKPKTIPTAPDDVQPVKSAKRNNTMPSENIIPKKRSAPSPAAKTVAPCPNIDNTKTKSVATTVQRKKKKNELVNVVPFYVELNPTGRILEAKSDLVLSPSSRYTVKTSYQMSSLKEFVPVASDSFTIGIYAHHCDSNLAFIEIISYGQCTLKRGQAIAYDLNEYESME